MAKELKKWNGTGVGRYNRMGLCVAAYSQKQAIEILQASVGQNYSAYDLKNYFHQCWGDNMKGIEPAEPCLYLIRDTIGKSTPELIYTLPKP